MNDDEKPDRLIHLGHCEGNTHHVLAMKDGKPVRVGHAKVAQDGQPLPQNCDVFHIESDTGRVVGTTRIGKGSKRRTGRPAQVATQQYRDNWDAIFGANKPSKELN